MKYAIMSDIHGNLEAFRRAVADARKRKCRKIICLGDLTGYGKQSKECVDYAMQNVDMCLMGNHDGCRAKARAAHIAHSTPKAEGCNLSSSRNSLAGGVPLPFPSAKMH